MASAQRKQGTRGALTSPPTSRLRRDLPDRSAKARSWATPVCVAAGLALYATLCLASMRLKSPTFDEVAYLPAGYMQLTRGDYRLMAEHPPLVKSVAALPLLAMDVQVPASDRAWARRRYFEFGRRFLFLWNDADRMIFRGRAVVVLMASALALTVFAWARRRWGAPVGGVAFFLCVLSPDVLAHGQLVTTDVPITLLVLLSVVNLDRLLEEVTWTRIVLGGLLLGCSFATKFSAFILLPVLAALVLAAVLSRRPMRLAAAGLSPRTLPLRRQRAAAAAVALVAMGILAPAVVWAAYGFQRTVTPDPAVNEVFALHHERPSSGLAWEAAGLAQRAGALPDGFLYGFLRFVKHSERRSAFLLGERSDEGWWYYFPVTLALKTPVPFLVLLLLAGVLFARKGLRSGTDAFLWVPVALYMGVAMARSLNIGHRHLLPILPFLFVAAARAVVWLWRRPGPARAVAGRRAFAGALLAGYAASVLAVHPHYLAYFNELAGGPARGYHLLVDSNLDWGQDLKGLKAYMDRNRIASLKLSYFGTAEPAYYGIRCERLPGHPPPDAPDVRVHPGDLVAVSATNLQAVYLDRDRDAERLMRRLRRLQPLDMVGYSILIYRADFNWRRR